MSASEQSTKLRFGDAWKEAGNAVLDGISSAADTAWEGIKSAGSWFIGLFR